MIVAEHNSVRRDYKQRHPHKQKEVIRKNLLIKSPAESTPENPTEGKEGDS